MKIQDLEARIAERADSVARDKIKVFQDDIDAALKKLFAGSGTGGVERFGCYGLSVKDHRAKDKDLDVARGKLAVLKLAIQNHTETQPTTKLPWPRVIWDLEIEVIRTELLSKMDLMQRLLASKPAAADDDITCEGDTVE